MVPADGLSGPQPRRLRHVPLAVRLQNYTDFHRARKRGLMAAIGPLRRRNYTAGVRTRQKPTPCPPAARGQCDRATVNKTLTRGLGSYKFSNHV